MFKLSPLLFVGLFTQPLLPVPTFADTKSSNNVSVATQQIVRIYPGTNFVSTLSGVMLKHARVSRAEPDGLTFTHSSGVTKVPFEDLPVSLQDNYGYSPDHARYYRSSRVITFTLFQDFEDGTALVEDEISGKTIYVSPSAEQIKSTFLGGGNRWRMRLYPAGYYKYTSRTGTDLTVPRYSTSWIHASSLVQFIGLMEDATVDYESKKELAREWRDEQERRQRIFELQRQTIAAEQAAEAAQLEADAKDRIADTLELQRQDEILRSKAEQSELENQTDELRRQNDLLDNINWQLKNRQDQY